MFSSLQVYGGARRRPFTLCSLYLSAGAALDVDHGSCIFMAGFAGDDHGWCFHDVEIYGAALVVDTDSGFFVAGRCVPFCCRHALDVRHYGRYDLKDSFAVTQWPRSMVSDSHLFSVCLT